MRNRIKATTILAIASLALLSVPAGLYAGDDADALTVNVPFDFIVENTTLPAGSYRVEHALENELNAWTIRSLNAVGHSVEFMTQSAEPSPNASRPERELTFMKIGDAHFLSEVWASGEGFQILPSRSMRDAEARENSREAIRIAGAG